MWVLRAATDLLLALPRSGFAWAPRSSVWKFSTRPEVSRAPPLLQMLRSSCCFRSANVGSSALEYRPRWIRTWPWPQFGRRSTKRKALCVSCCSYFEVLLVLVGFVLLVKQVTQRHARYILWRLHSHAQYCTNTWKSRKIDTWRLQESTSWHNCFDKTEA